MKPTETRQEREARTRKYIEERKRRLKDLQKELNSTISSIERRKLKARMHKMQREINIKESKQRSNREWFLMFSILLMVIVALSLSLYFIKEELTANFPKNEVEEYLNNPKFDEQLPADRDLNEEFSHQFLEGNG